MYIVHVYVLSHVQLFATPKDCSLPGSSVHGIFQAKILERVAISSSRGSSLQGTRDRTRVMHSGSLQKKFGDTTWDHIVMWTGDLFC